MLNTRAAYLFILPSLILYFTFVGLPILQVFGFSFFNWSNGFNQGFAGLDNYAKLLNDHVFWNALWHNALWVILTLAFPLMAGLLLAAILAERHRRLIQWLGAIYFIPRTIPLVVAGVIWSWIYNPIFGLLNFVLDFIGLGSFSKAWLGESSSALLALNVVGSWTFFGFCLIIYLAAIQSIDPSLYEAASIDGAKWWRKFKDLTVPLLKNSTLFLGLYAAIEAMRFFDLVWVTTQGGPGYATEVLTTHIYKTFFNIGDFGYASALSVTLLIIVLSISGGAFWMMRKK